MLPETDLLALNSLLVLWFSKCVEGPSVEGGSTGSNGPHVSESSGVSSTCKMLRLLYFELFPAFFTGT